MKKIIALLFTIVVLCAAMAMPASAASGTVICDYNFEDGKVCLDNVAGGAEIAEEKGNKIMKLTRNDEQYFFGIINADSATDFDMSLRVRLDRCVDEQWNWVKLVFRAPGYSENEAYHMHLYTSRVEFAGKGGKVHKDEMQPIVTNEQQAIRLKNWYTVEISARGNKMTAFVNGKKVLEMTDTDFTEGGFALCSWAWDFSVDDIKIVERSATDAVKSNFKGATTDNKTTSSTSNNTSSTTSSTASEVSDNTSSTTTSTASKATTSTASSSTSTTSDGETISEGGSSNSSVLVTILGIVAIVVVIAIGAFTVLYIIKNMPEGAKKKQVKDDE